MLADLCCGYSLFFDHADRKEKLRKSSLLRNQRYIQVDIIVETPKVVYQDNLK